MNTEMAGALIVIAVGSVSAIACLLALALCHAAAWADRKRGAL